jgi:hypothetical protein
LSTAENKKTRVYFGRFLIAEKNGASQWWKVSGFSDSDFEAREMLKGAIQEETVNNPDFYRLDIIRKQILYFDATVLEDSNVALPK